MNFRSQPIPPFTFLSKRSDHHIRWWGAFVVLWLVLSSNAQGQAEIEAIEASFELSEPARTSAGVFTEDGRLLRTLWSNVAYDAGTHAFSWDGMDDLGEIVPEGVAHHFEVLAHNVEYIWEGVIGNTSRELTGQKKHRSFQPPWDLEFHPDGRGFLVTGYNEQSIPFAQIQMDNYQERTHFGRDDYKTHFEILSVDATHLYVANTGTSKSPESFIVRFDLSDGLPQSNSSFPTGVEKTVWEGVVPVRSSPISGLAVQRNGTILFAALGEGNEVAMYDKSTGELIGAFYVEAPQELVCSDSGDLWVIAGLGESKNVQRWSGFPEEPAKTLQIELSNPLALAIQPDGESIVVADGGNSQQVRAFDVDGNELWTLGEAGGYLLNGPEVKSSKFFFRHLGSEWVDRTFLSYSPDGHLWVGDLGNYRILIFDQDRNFLDTLMYLPRLYTCAVDTAAPTRVFADWLEFKIDYDEPIQKSWELVRNWAAGMPSTFQIHSQGINVVRTFSSEGENRTFALVQNPIGDAESNLALMELPPSGILRDTSMRFGKSASIYRDGSLRRYEHTETHLLVYQKAFSQFDVDGNPVWGEEREIAAAPRGPTDPYYRPHTFSSPSGARFPSTASGLVVFFDGEEKNRTDPEYRGFHLGAVADGESSWHWKASPSGEFKAIQPDVFPPRWEVVDPDGSFDVNDPSTRYAGNRVLTIDKEIVYGYHGENWKRGQANQWLHFRQNGLFFGQFGTPNFPGSNRFEALPGAAGNAFNPEIVEVNGEYYLWHNDEMVHSGVHRWHISNLESIREFAIPLLSSNSFDPFLPSTSYTDWALHYSISDSELERMKDRDGDGIPNLHEYLFFSNPLEWNKMEYGTSIVENNDTHLLVRAWEPVAHRDFTETWEISAAGVDSWSSIAPSAAQFDTVEDSVQYRLLEFPAQFPTREFYLRRTLVGTEPE